MVVYMSKVILIRPLNIDEDLIKLCCEYPIYITKDDVDSGYDWLIEKLYSPEVFILPEDLNNIEVGDNSITKFGIINGHDLKNWSISDNKLRDVRWIYHTRKRKYRITSNTDENAELSVKVLLFSSKNKYVRL